MPMLRVSTMPIIASFRKALVAVDRLYPTRSAMLVNTTGPPLGYNLASAAITSRSLYDGLPSISFITFIVITHLLSLLLDYLITGLAHGHAHTVAPARWGGTSETASMYALTNTAATCGTIALPAPRRRATRPGIPSTKGSRPGLMRLSLPSAHRSQTASPQQPFTAPAVPDPAASVSACSPPASPLERPSFRPRRPNHSESATHHSRCLMCGAPTPAAGRSAAPTAYPIDSRSDRTPASHRRPSALATCSPKTTGGLHWSMSHRHAHHRARGSSSPPLAPAWE